MDGWGTGAPELEQRRRRTRTLGCGALVVLGLVALGGARWGLGRAEAMAVGRWGDTSIDRAIDGDRDVVSALVITSDDLPGGWVVSYEYYYDASLYIGYQRVSADVGRTFAVGDDVDVEVASSDPVRSRLGGTRFRPYGWVGDGLRALQTGVVVIAAGIAVSIAALGRRFGLIGRSRASSSSADRA